MRPTWHEQHLCTHTRVIQQTSPRFGMYPSPCHFTYNNIHIYTTLTLSTTSPSPPLPPSYHPVWVWPCMTSCCYRLASIKVCCLWCIQYTYTQLATKTCERPNNEYVIPNNQCKLSLKLKFNNILTSSPHHKLEEGGR